MNFFSENNLEYLNNFFVPRNIISFLILISPFSLGKFPILSFSYLIYTYLCILILGFQLISEIPKHMQLINFKIFVLIAMVVLSFFVSMIFGLDYKVISDLTDFDSSFNGVLFDVFTFVPMQSLLIFLIYISVNDIEDINHYIKMIFISGFIVNLIAIYYVFSNPSGRLGATFSDSNYLGRFEIFIIVLSISYIFFKGKGSLEKYFLIVNIFISFVLMYLTYSRSAVLTLGIIVSLMFIFNGKTKIKYILVILVIVVLVLAFSYITSSRIDSDSMGGGGFLYKVFFEPSNFTRIILNYAGLKMFLDYPLFGVGYHNFYNVYINYSYIPLEITLLFSKNNSVIHSWLFSVFAEQGLFGAVPLIILFHLMFKKMYKLIKNKLFVEYRFYSISLYSLFFVLIFNGLFFPVFFPELIFSLLIGIILGYFKVVNCKDNLSHLNEL